MNSCIRGLIFSFILLLILFNSICLAINIKQVDPCVLETNLSEMISYNALETLQSKPITVFEKMETNSLADSILAIAPITDRVESSSDQKLEKKLLAKQKGVVSRSGKALIIKTQSGFLVKLTNMFKPEGKDHEGDSQKYFYAGILASTGYHTVKVDYMHDSPGTYFVNPNTGSKLYAQTSEHSVFLSPNNRLLVINDSELNPPFGLVLAAISDQGHQIELNCISHKNSDPKQRGQFEGWDNKISSNFKGWHDKPEVGFDLVLKMPKSGASEKHKEESLIPIQFSFVSGQWHIFVPDSKINALSSRLTCWQ
jgi:hypothetical protein